MEEKKPLIHDKNAHAILSLDVTINTLKSLLHDPGNEVEMLFKFLNQWNFPIISSLPVLPGKGMDCC